MPSLAELSHGRIASGLGAIVGEFAPGQPLPVRLVAGRDAALAVLRRYVPELQFDVRQADAQMRDIDAWADRNEDALKAIMASPLPELPEQLRLTMGAERARQLIISSFTQAAAGLGPWMSGAVARLASEDKLINERWARTDAAARLDMFALIVKLERDGQLAPLFVAPKGGAAGFGALPLWFVAVVLVIVAAAIVTTVVLWRRIDINNRLMRDICERAQREGDKETVRLCIEATKGLQVGELERIPGKIAYALLAAGAVYLGLRFGLPMLTKRSQERYTQNVRRPRVWLKDLGPKWDPDIKGLMVGQRRLATVQVVGRHIYAETIPLDKNDWDEWERALAVINRRLQRIYEPNAPWLRRRLS